MNIFIWMHSLPVYFWWDKILYYQNRGCTGSFDRDHRRYSQRSTLNRCCYFESIIIPNLISTSPKPSFGKMIQTLSLRDWQAWSELMHGDIIKWKHFPRYWSFVRGIHRWPHGNSPVTGEFPSQRWVTRSFDIFDDLNKCLSKQYWGWLFGTLSRP